VEFDRVDRDAERSGGFLVAHALPDQGKDLCFARSEERCVFAGRAEAFG
jgi:hypothetical protein